MWRGVRLWRLGVARRMRVLELGDYGCEMGVETAGTERRRGG